MIYSPDHNFLLLKNRKVGGSSLEVALSRVLPDNAIVTKLVGPNNTTDPVPSNHFERNYGDYFHAHIKYDEIKEKINLSDVKSYVFVRNPYNSVLSAFFHRLNNSKLTPRPYQWNDLPQYEKDFWIEKYFDERIGSLPWYKSDKYIYINKNNLPVVDKILYYENGIEEEINPILKFHGIPEIILNVNQLNYRPKEITYKDVFKEKHLEMIRKDWWWEFKNLNYQI